MRKNIRGRVPNFELKERVKKLREQNYSYPEIARILGFHNRQMARYYDKRIWKAGKESLDV